LARNSRDLLHDETAVLHRVVGLSMSTSTFSPLLGASIPLPRGSSGQVLRLFRSAKEEKRIAGEGGEKNHTDPRWRGKKSDRYPRALRREGDKFPAS